MKTALILGATGLVGASCLKQILNDERYERVVCINRTNINLTHPKLIQHVVDFSLLENVEYLFSADQVFCCLGTTLKKAKSKKAFAAIDLNLVSRVASLAKKNNVKVFTVISSFGANSKSFNYYSSTKGKMEQALIALNFEQLIIIRPSLLLGERTEHRRLEKLSSDIFNLVKPMFIGPLKLFKPINVADVAKGMIKAANETQAYSKVTIVENHQLSLS